MAELAGFRVVVVDDRDDFADPARFPMAAEVRAGPWDEILGSLETGDNTYVVIVTRGHRMDGTCLSCALSTPARYIGMIGSKRKIRAIYADLRANGSDERALARVRAPIGLDIGAQTSEEIAVAIVAEMIAVRRRTGDGGSLADRARPDVLGSP